jgi:hypothetical protein
MFQAKNRYPQALHACRCHVSDLLKFRYAPRQETSRLLLRVLPKSHLPQNVKLPKPGNLTCQKNRRKKFSIKTQVTKKFLSTVSEGT